MSSISQENFNKLIDLLKQSGLAKNVITDPVKMQETLKKILGKENAAKFLSVWHGSTHAFDKFSTAYIGSGEGHQSYGWGLYFTDLREIAESYATVRYKEDYIKNEMEFLNPTLHKMNGGKYIIETVASLRLDGKENLRSVITSDIVYNNKKAAQYPEIKIYQELIANAQAALDIIDNSDLEIIFSKPARYYNLYSVKIHSDKTANELNFIRWRKPLTEKQRRAIIKGLENLKRNKAGYEDLELDNRDIDIYINSIKKDTEYVGGIIYGNIASLFGDQRLASEFLLRAGIDGVQYPAEYQSKGTHEEYYNYVVFDENVINITDNIRFMATPKNEIYGFITTENEVYIDKNRLNVNTPIHEFGHLWNNFIKKNNPDLWKKGSELIKNSPYWEKVNNNPTYAKFTKEQKIDEALAHAICDNGAKMWKNGEIQDNKLIQWLKKAWEFIRKSILEVIKKTVNTNEDKIDHFAQNAVYELTNKQDLATNITLKRKLKL